MDNVSWSTGVQIPDYRVSDETKQWYRDMGDETAAWIAREEETLRKDLMVLSMKTIFCAVLSFIGFSVAFSYIWRFANG